MASSSASQSGGVVEEDVAKAVTGGRPGNDHSVDVKRVVRVVVSGPEVRVRESIDGDGALGRVVLDEQVAGPGANGVPVAFDAGGELPLVEPFASEPEGGFLMKAYQLGEIGMDGGADRQGQSSSSVLDVVVAGKAARS